MTVEHKTRDHGLHVKSDLLRLICRDNSGAIGSVSKGRRLVAVVARVEREINIAAMNC